MKYQVGDLIDFEEDDPVFDTREEAINRAYELSDENYETPFGIWTGQDDGSELVAIAFAGEIYQK